MHLYELIVKMLEAGTCAANGGIDCFCMAFAVPTFPIDSNQKMNGVIDSDTNTDGEVGERVGVNPVVKERDAKYGYPNRKKVWDHTENTNFG